MQCMQCAPVAFAQHQNVVPVPSHSQVCNVHKLIFCLSKHILNQLGLGGFKISALEP